MALDETHKARLKAHMNKEHTTELKQYLRAFNHLSASAAHDAQLTDLTLDTLIIQSASGTHSVPISPPLGSLADARVRLVDMSQHAQAKLGLSDIRIATYTRPEGAGVISFVGISLYFVCAATLGLVQPGTGLWNVLDSVFPYGAPGYRWLVKAIFVPVLAIHVTEAWWMASTRLRKHGVENGIVWWAWVVNTFLEGYPTMMRFDGLVEAERVKKETAKH